MKYLFGIVALVVLVGAGYFIYEDQTESDFEKAAEEVEDVAEDITQ